MKIDSVYHGVIFNAYGNGIQCSIFQGRIIDVLWIGVQKHLGNKAEDRIDKGFFFGVSIDLKHCCHVLFLTGGAFQ